jgi:pantoate--beta-alanine ligase
MSFYAVNSFMVKIVKTIHELRNILREIRQDGRTIGFVPTMGALHSGHGSLIDMAKSETDICVVSIFVNPKQFAPHEDLATYPRPIDDDIAFLSQKNADILFLPNNNEIYPDDFITQISLKSGVALGLEAAVRPHFFDGVATVVTKLLMCVFPDIAYFGEKDYQQLCVIKQLVKDLNIPIHIQGVPTVRSKDGLALSSRNGYLSENSKQAASLLNKVLYDIAIQIENGTNPQIACDMAKDILLQNGFDKIDYITVKNSDNLSDAITNNGRILAAAYIQNVRLIDNIAF